MYSIVLLEMGLNAIDIVAYVCFNKRKKLFICFANKDLREKKKII